MKSESLVRNAMMTTRERLLWRIGLGVRQVAELEEAHRRASTPATRRQALAFLQRAQIVLADHRRALAENDAQEGVGESGADKALPARGDAGDRTDMQIRRTEREK